MSHLPALGPRGEGWVVGQVALALAVIASGGAGPAWGGAARVLTTVGGLAVAGAGGLLALRGARGLGRSLTPLPHPRPAGELVDTGVYRRVRHPIYGGLVLATAGWALATASLRALVLTPVVATFLALKARREEAWLVEQFPEYAAYQRRTRPFLPGIG